MIMSTALTNIFEVEGARCTTIQGTFKRSFPGLVNFVPAAAYHYCLNLPEAFSQPGNGLLEVPYKMVTQHTFTLLQ